MSAPALGSLVQRAFRPRTPGPQEGCGLCGVAIDPRHGHVVNVIDRQLLCVCRGCYLLFAVEGAGGRRFVAVPERCREVQGDLVTSVISEVLQVPVGLAFFFINSHRQQVVALYPSPSGATESTLPLAQWDDVVDAAPDLTMLQPDVEALLVRSRHDGPMQSLQSEEHRRAGNRAYVVPIDLCYELVGRLRRSWEGFSGGTAWRELDVFFDDLDRRVRGEVA